MLLHDNQQAFFGGLNHVFEHSAAISAAPVPTHSHQLNEHEEDPP